MKGLHSIENGLMKAKISEKGGTTTSLTIGRKKIFAPFQIIEGKERGGCPICAPWFGSSPRGEKKHGFLRDLKADISIVGEDEGEFSFFEKKTESYPWIMDYTTRAAIYEKRTLNLILEIDHHHDGIPRKAPVLPGFHPYFACDDASKVEVFAGGRKYKGFEKKSKMFPLKKREILISIPGKWDIEMTLKGDFFKHAVPQMVFWSDSPDKYFCVEPILQDQKLFDTSKGFYLGESESLYLEVSFRVC